MLGIVLFVLVVGTVLDDAYAANICFDAKICVHNAVEKCGSDPKLGLRRFLDSCDIKEYNCQKKSNYAATSMDNCKDLPPLDK